jgi:hypothetical protein
MTEDQSVTAIFTPQPTAQTHSVTKLTSTSAMLTGVGNVHGNLGSTWFEYGITPAYGTTRGTQTIATSTDTMISQVISGLSPHTLYHYRFCIQVADKIICGSDQSFSTRSTTLGDIGNVNLIIPATESRIDGYDLIALGIAFGSDASMANWNPLADLDGDGIIDGNDLTILAINFGRVEE